MGGIQRARCDLLPLFEPIDFSSMEVDHIIPESLPADPDEYTRVLASFGLDVTFDVNSFENWLPSCRRCNGQKSDTTFTALPIIAVQLDRAARKAEKARKTAAQTVSDKKLGDALGVVERALTLSDLPATKVQPLVAIYLQDHPEVVRAMLEDLDARNNGISRTDLSFMFEAPPLLELRLTPFARVLYTIGRAEIVATPHGVGYRPTGSNIDASYYCGHCGSLGPWSGARCLTCGYLSEND